MYQLVLEGKVLVDRKGDPILDQGQPIYLSKQVAELLSNLRKGDARKLWALSERFESERVVELDKADLKLLKDTMDGNEVTEMTKVMLRAQILNLLDEATEVDEVKKAGKKKGEDE